MRFKLILSLLLLQITFVFSQQKKQPKTEFEIKFDTLLKVKNFNKILNLFYDFELKKKPTLTEKQIYFSCKGKYYSEIRRKEEALVNYQKSLNYITNSDKSTEIKLDIYERIADINFTFQDYGQAIKYAKLAEPFIDKSNYFDYINIHSIIGYSHYIQNNFELCSKEYDKVHTLILDKKDYCKEPEILMKIAKLKSKLGNFNQAIIDIDNCMITAKKCNIGVYFPAILMAKYDILKDNKKYKEALIFYEEAYRVTDSLGFRKQNQKDYELQFDFDKKLKEKENQNLKLLNLKEKELVSNQKLAMIVLGFGLLLISVLVVFLFKLTKRQKKTNVIVAQNNQDLKRLNLLNQKIFSVISHDFKAPISTLRLFLDSKEVIKTENKELKKYADDAVLQLDQSDFMLNSLLDWAKIELNLSESSKQFKVNEIINTISIQLKGQLLAKNIQLKNDIVNDSVINFPSEIALIVLRNIINNAIKFSFEDGIIEISHKQNTLLIKDSGKGIDPKKIARLFKSDVEPGFGTKFETGFGMGLYLSNELMNKNHGSISVSNNLDQGCTFFVNF